MSKIKVKERNMDLAQPCRKLRWSLDLGGGQFRRAFCF